MRKFILGFTCLIATSGAGYAQTLVDRIVAVVDKEIITESELQDRVNFFAIQNRLDPTKPELRQQVLDALVTEKLILAQAILDSVQVSDEEVTRTLDQQIQNLVRQLGSEQRVEQTYGKPISRIRREFREEMKKQLLVQRVRQNREANVTVTRREVEEFYQTYKDSLPQVPEEFELSQIFIVPKPDSLVEAQTRKTMEAIRDSIVGGGDFAAFAKRYSIDATASSGGDLGWAKRGDYVHEFEEAVFGMKEGEISPVIKTQFGFHIVQLLARRGESVHARHILMRIEKGPRSDSAAVDTLRALRARALHGESFAELAKKYSEDEDTKALGGDLGTVTSEQLTPAFAATLHDVGTGDISAPTRVSIGTSYGFQIVLVRKRTPAHPISLDGDFKRLEQLALYVKKNKENSEWIQELKKTIYCHELTFPGG
ncbi:MAG TPA: peptidylprolyl isomerase [Bacteroidota bacterium]|nr:peptidylprolyl isomerase [Bacteroidota bacterium]